MVTALTAQPVRRDRPVSGAVPGRPIKVCVISPLGYGLYRPQDGRPFGGAEVQFYLLAQELAADPNFQVSVLTTVEGAAGVDRHGPVTVVKRKGQGRLSGKGGGSPLGWLSAFRDMRRTFRSIDADVYLHAGSGVEVGAYALICREARRRFVFVLASSADVAPAQPLVRGPLKPLYSLGVKWADAVVCRTVDQLEALRREYGRDGVLIRTGHAIPAESHVRPSAGGTILWVGRMHPLKQPHLFLDLAERSPRERFVLVAAHDDAHGELRKSVRRRVMQLENVEWHEDVPWAAIGGFFREARLFINTSTYEGFPNTFVQAAMQGTPILSWAVDPDRVLARHRIGLCAGGSFDCLTEALHALCRDEVFREELSANASAYARQFHDIRRTGGQFKEVLRTLVHV